MALRRPATSSIIPVSDRAGHYSQLLGHLSLKEMAFKPALFQMVAEGALPEAPIRPGRNRENELLFGASTGSAGVCRSPSL